MLEAETPPSPQHRGKGFVDVAPLLWFAAQQGNAFSVLPQARERITVFRFGLVLALRDRAEVAADEQHQSARRSRVDDRGNDEKRRNGHGPRLEMNRD